MSRLTGRSALTPRVAGGRLWRRSYAGVTLQECPTSRTGRGAKRHGKAAHDGFPVRSVKGHAKEAAGIVTGDKKLQAQGKADRRTGEAEEKVDQAKNWVGGLFDKVKEVLHLK